MTEAELEARIAALEAALAQRSVVAVEIVDERGRTRAMLTTGHRGEIALNLLDEAGVLRAGLGLTAGGPTLALFDAAGGRRLELQVGADDAPRLHFHDEAGGKRLDAVVDPAGTASIGLVGADGVARAVMMATATGRGVVGASAS